MGKQPTRMLEQKKLIKELYTGVGRGAGGRGVWGAEWGGAVSRFGIENEHNCRVTALPSNPLGKLSNKTTPRPGEDAADTVSTALDWQSESKPMPLLEEQFRNICKTLKDQAVSPQEA